MAGFRVSHRGVLVWKWPGAAQIRILAEFAGFIHPFPSTYFMAHSTSIASVMKYVKCKASQLLLFLSPASEMLRVSVVRDEGCRESTGQGLR